MKIKESIKQIINHSACNEGQFKGRIKDYILISLAENDTRDAHLESVTLMGCIYVIGQVSCS